MVWHDVEGRSPDWEIPAIAEYGQEKWTRCKQMTWEINSCNQEMAENQVDAAHFCYLHGTVGLPKTTTTIVNKHHLHTVSTTRMTTPGGEVDGQIEVNAYGFGFTTTRFNGIVETLLISSATPIHENRCKLWFSFTIKQFGGAEITQGIGRAFVKEISRQLEQDIPIWENKIYLPRPLLCDGDGPIGKFRVWSKNFYPKPEPKQQTA